MENEDKVKEQLVQTNQALQAEIYERQQTEEALRHRLAMEELVATISARFISVGSDEIEREINHSLRELGEFADVDHSHVTLFSKGGTTIDRMYEWHSRGIEPRAQDLEGASLDPFQWVMGQLGRSETVHVPRVADLPPEANAERELWEANGIRSVLTIPLVLSDSPIGALGFSAERTDKEWSAEDIRLLKLVGQVLTNAFACKQAEQALKESEERLRLALEATREGLWENNYGRKPDYLNDRMYTMLGYEPVDPAVGVEFFGNLVHPDDRNRIVAACDGLSEPGNDDYEVEFRLKAKDGSWRFILSRGRCVERDCKGKVARLLGMHTDITERRRLEEAYRTSVEHSLQGLAILQDGRMVFANPATANMTGYTVEEQLSASPQEIRAAVYAEDRARVLSNMRDHLAGKAVSPRQAFRLVRQDRAVRWVETLTTRVTYQGKPALQINYMDVTEHRLADEALQRSLEETARGQRLLLALSQAAQAVERARTTQEVYHIVGDQVAALGYNATIFTLTNDRTYLAVSHLTFDSALLRAAERLTGFSAQGYRFPLTSGGFLEQVLHGTEAVFTRDDERPFLEALPGLIRPLAGRLIDLLGMDQSIVVPLMVNGEVHGLLAVTGNGLSEADASAVSAFANQAAIAIENAELLTTVTEQRRDLRRLSARLMGAQEKERARLSRELHDEIGQALTAMSINLAEIEKRLGPKVNSLIGKRLRETCVLTDQTSERISALALDLRPSLLDDLGLVSTLRWYASRYSERLGIQVEVQMVDLEKRLAPEVETALYRVVQEALTNVARHARATKVRLRLERKVSSAVATIEDNGQGFDTKEHTGRQPPQRGAGLVGMQERIALLGGSFCIQSDLGKGTRLSVEIPL